MSEARSPNWPRCAVCRGIGRVNKAFCTRCNATGQEPGVGGEVDDHPGNAIRELVAAALPFCDPDPATPESIRLKSARQHLSDWLDVKG